MLQIQTYNYAVEVHYVPRHQHILKSSNSTRKTIHFEHPLRFLWKHESSYQP